MLIVPNSYANEWSQREVCKFTAQNQSDVIVTS